MITTKTVSSLPVLIGVTAGKKLLVTAARRTLARKVSEHRGQKEGLKNPDYLNVIVYLRYRGSLDTSFLSLSLFSSL